MTYQHCLPFATDNLFKALSLLPSYCKHECVSSLDVSGKSVNEFKILQGHQDWKNKILIWQLFCKLMFCWYTELDQRLMLKECSVQIYIFFQIYPVFGGTHKGISFVRIAFVDSIRLYIAAYHFILKSMDTVFKKII